jgi:hypothetical protein
VDHVVGRRGPFEVETCRCLTKPVNTSFCFLQKHERQRRSTGKAALLLGKAKKCSSRAFCRIELVTHKSDFFPVLSNENHQKKFASLRLCVSFLFRDHANLLCFLDYLRNVRPEGRTIIGTKLGFITVDRHGSHPIKRLFTFYFVATVAWTCEIQLEYFNDAHHETKRCCQSSNRLIGWTLSVHDNGDAQSMEGNK